MSTHKYMYVLLLVGETKKMVTLTILDDLEPEDNESIIISLIRTEGGSQILPSFDTVTVIILASDNVAGIISFQTASRSVIGREGGFFVLATLSVCNSHFHLCAVCLLQLTAVVCITIQRMPASRQ